MTELFGLPLTREARAHLDWSLATEILWTLSYQINEARLKGLEPFKVHYDRKWIVMALPPEPKTSKKRIRKRKAK